MSDIVKRTNVLAAVSHKKNPDSFDEPRATRPNGIINKLNHDCLAKVLMHLPVLDRLEMEKVCRKWKEATEMSWYNVKKLDSNDLMIPLDKVRQIINSILIKCGQYLRHLTMHYKYPWICNIIKNCHNVIHFDVVYFGVTIEDVLKTTRSMPKLKYLKITVHMLNPGNICNQILEVLPDNMEEIHFFTTGDEPVLPDSFNCLRSLSLYGFSLTSAFMESLLLNKNTLVYLDLSGCKFSSGVSSIFSNLNNLEYINLNQIKQLNNIVIREISQNCPKLKHLKFANRDGNGDPGIYRLKYLQNLEHLELPELDYDDNFITEIANNCKKIKYLNVRGGRDFTTIDFQEITKLKNLEYLNLSSRETPDLQALIDIVNNCLELKDLNMTFKATPAIVLDKLPNLKKLEKLQFHGCNNLTDNILVKIASNCKNLVKLRIDDCSSVTEASLLQIGKLKYLEELVLHNIANVPNAMFNNFRKLEWLICRRCSTVTDEGIMKVLDNCQNLAHLDMRETGITVKTVIHASKRQFVYVPLFIWVEQCVYQDYHENAIESPHLTIVW